MAATVLVAGVQCEPKLMDREANWRTVEAGLADAAKAGARLAIFPEAMVTGYCYETKAEALPYAEPADGPSVARLAPTCRRLGIHAILGTLERDGDDL